MWYLHRFVVGEVGMLFSWRLQNHLRAASSFGSSVRVQMCRHCRCNAWWFWPLVNKSQPVCNGLSALFGCSRFLPVSKMPARALGIRSIRTSGVSQISASVVVPVGEFSAVFIACESSGFRRVNRPVKWAENVLPFAGVANAARALSLRVPAIVIAFVFGCGASWACDSAEE